MKQLVLALMLLSVLPALAEANTIEYFEGNININSTKTSFLISMIFDRPPTGIVEYPLFYRIEGFQNAGNIGGAVCEAQRKPWGTNIVCDFRNTQGTGRTLEIKYETSVLVKLVEGQRLFSTTVRVPEDTGRMVVRTYLGNGFVLIDPDKGPLPPYTPSDGVSGSDGRRIFVIWTRNETTKGEGLDMTVAYERILPPTSGFSTILLVGAGALFVALIAIVLVKRRKGDGTKIVVPLTLLKDDERKIVEYLQSQGGITKQRALVTHTGFSKAKISRLVRDLQTRGVIKVKGVGRVNEITLTPVLQKVEDDAKTAKTPENEPNKPQEPHTTEEKK